MKKILIIDDEEKIRTLMGRIIGLEGFDVYLAADCKSGLKRLEQTAVDVVLCDVKLPDGNGIDLTAKIKEVYAAVEIILLTAYGNIPDGVQAVKNGAFDYIVKGDDNNKIVPLLHRALEKRAMTQRITKLEAELDYKFSFDRIIGQSKSFLQSVNLAQKVADSDTTVLLTGETGTGKEVFANAIHQASARKDRNFVAINCSAFSHDLLESEMFGHTASAFTGASKEKKGLFEEADNGTIFLDEVGEMALDLQAKLLRTIESGEFIKIGESKPTRVNVRILAATNRNLLQEIELGHFRRDLFYRLAVFQIELPALRERIIDIEPLAMFFLKGLAAKSKKKFNGFSEPYLQSLKLHNWPGNIRELKNIIERSVILETSPWITTDTLSHEFGQLSLQAGGPSQTPASLSLATAESLHIQKVLNFANHNKTETAKLLQIALTTLYRKLEEYQIS